MWRWHDQEEVIVADDLDTERAAQKALKQIKLNKALYDAGQMAQEGRAAMTADRTYTKVPANSRAGGGAGTSEGGGADMEMMHGMLAPNPKPTYKKGGAVKKFKHHDGIAQRGKTRA